MENYIVCPHCHKTITNRPLIDAAAAGTGNGSQNINCDCGEKLTYWAISAQLRDQKSIGGKVQKWWRDLTKATH